MSGLLEVRRKTLASPSGRLAVMTLALLFCVFGFLCLLHFPFLADDALISFRYAARLASGDGLTWTPGERVEGYSNLLWVLIHAPFALVGLDLPLVSPVLGVCGGLVGLVAAAFSPRSGRLSLVRTVVGGGFLATLVPYAVWCIGGLEQGVLTAALMVTLVLIERESARLEGRFASTATGGREAAPWAVGACLVALTLLRVDGLLLCALLCLGIALQHLPRRDGLVFALRLAAFPLVAAVAQFAFRLAYYGDYVSNTARAKVAFTPARLVSGAGYVWDGMLATGVGVGALGVVILWTARGAGRRLAPSLTCFAGWLAYLVVVGGDIFPAWRLLLPALAALAHAAALGADVVITRRLLAPKVVAALAVNALGVPVQLADETNEQARIERWEWDGKTIGPLLATGFADEQPLVAVEAAGAVPYWSGLPALDMMGLTDRHLATHRPRTFGRGMIGHELGDPEYVLRRQPDLVAFCLPASRGKSCSPQGERLRTHPLFRKSYRLTTVAADDNHGVSVYAALYVRLDGRVGIRRSAERVLLPGHLLAGNPRGYPAATLDDDGRFGVTLDFREQVRTISVPLEPGTWRLEAVYEDGPRRLASASVDVTFSCGATMASVQSDRSVLELEESSDVVVFLQGRGTTVRLLQLEFVRSEEDAGAHCTGAL